MSTTRRFNAEARPLGATRSLRLGLPLLVALPFLFLAACDPTSGLIGPELDDRIEEAVNEGWGELVTLDSLGIESLERLASAADSTIALHLAGATLLAAEIEDVERGGGAGLTLEGGLMLELEGALDEQWAAVVADVLGAAVVDEAIAGADATVRRVEALGMSAARRASLARARVHLARAATARARGERGTALAEASRAADALRELSPERRAAALVRTARAWLTRAEEAAGASPSPEVESALERAGEQCRLAEASLAAGEVRDAVRAALRCGRLARRVVLHLSGGLPDELLAERAAEAVDRARGYLARAMELAGDDASAGIESALTEARALLGVAEEALEGDQYRRAIRAAHASAAISRRVLAALLPVADGVEARAEIALEFARVALGMAVEAAGEDPADAVAVALERAEGLLAEAASAFEAGAWRETILKANAVTMLARRILLHLAS